MKYDNLSKYLKAECKDTVSLSFAELESILGFQLPRSAYTYQVWWANGGHVQAAAWLNAGFLVDNVSLTDQYVVFRKDPAATARRMAMPKKSAPAAKPQNAAATATQMAMPEKSAPEAKPPVHIPTALDRALFTDELMNVCGYPFRFLQEILPECDREGRLIDYYPQDDYPQKNRKRLNQYGAGAFCRFSIRAEDVPGVYLWVVDGRIIYIGETVKLRQRFNSGYGVIQPVNCYLGGQTTNCKMNKVVRSLFLKGKRVQLYFYQTTDNKRVELELLNRIKTPYNVKDNE